ncbi:hypothetical protein K8O68_14175 [Salipaludibacillus sp. CUR1]|uniref:Uncharacterized protein n=1 Tax=Salipaludibacillus aurantiacus TaxID=1601833 RepID=A0A1H9X3C2_9BACI|nr:MULTISPECIES: hypothetical protein [Salipaludibacillus]MCE7793568.1 hypothetical protein [Salipaludibacillus sp. CUR1]SES40133.1 hypothetical protein SAMN05518684_12312 [Salipaludibacillus aurantiacus]
MMFEFSQDLVPVLLTISLYMTFAGAHLIQFMSHESAAANRSLTQKQLHSWHSRLAPSNMLLDLRVDRLSWLTRMMGRKEGPEDDGDYLSFSIDKLQTHRGGYTWKKTLYSPDLKNIVRLF